MAGRARDGRSSECLAARETRAIAAGAGVLVPAERAEIQCPEGGELVSASRDGSTVLGCLPFATGRVSRTCPPGAVADGERCVDVVDRAGRVDVATWARVVLGVDGGAGSASLCRGAGEGFTAIGAGGTVSIAVRVDLRFPDNDVSQVVATVHGSAVELDAVVSPLVEALRTLGGVASQAEASVAVTCPARATRPAARIP